jgi:hypothetical protein
MAGLFSGLTEQKWKGSTSEATRGKPDGENERR